MKKCLALICVLALCNMVNAFAGGIVSFPGGGVPSGGGASCSGDYGDTSVGVDVGPGGAPALKTVLIRIPLSCDGPISSMSAYGKYLANNTGAEITFVCYDDNGSGTDPNNLLGEYGNITSGGPAGTGGYLTDSSVSETISGTPGYIWCGIHIETNTSQFWDNTGSGTVPYRQYTESSYRTFSDPWPTGSDSEGTTDYGFYVTF